MSRLRTSALKLAMQKVRTTLQVACLLLLWAASSMLCLSHLKTNWVLPSAAEEWFDGVHTS